MRKISKVIQHGPDSLFSWFVCVCASVCQGLNIGFAVSYGILLPEVMKEFEESRQKTVWVGSLGFGLTFFLGPLTSFVCQTIGCRIPAILGCLLCGTSFFLTAHATSLQWMFPTYGCLYGLGSSLLFVSYFLITAKNFCKWRFLAVGIVSVGGSIGVLILGPVLQLLIDNLGWRGTYRMMSIPFFVMACICGATFGHPVDNFSKPVESAMFLMEIDTMKKDFEISVNETHRRNAYLQTKRDSINKDRYKVEQKFNQTRSMQAVEVKASYLQKKNSENSSEMRTLRKLLDLSVFKVPSYTVAMISLLLMNFGHFVPQLYLVKYCLDLGISADSASKLFILLGLSSSVARVITGRMCDVKWINVIYIYQFGDLLIGLVIISLPLIKSYSGLQVFSVFYGVGDGIFTTTMNSLLVFSVDEERRAAGLGLGNMLLSLGIVAGPPFAGFLVDMSDCYTWAFFMAGIVTQLAGLMPLVLFCFKNKKDCGPKEYEIRETRL